jgi:hypothetical protein
LLGDNEEYHEAKRIDQLPAEIAKGSSEYKVQLHFYANRLSVTVMGFRKWVY